MTRDPSLDDTLLSSSGNCLSDDELAMYVDGEMNEAERARLRAHLDGCSSCRHILAATIRLATEGETSSELALPPLDRAGRYELGEVLGMGAMGIVYSAFDPELGRRIACKLLRRTTSDPRAQETRRRFVREAKSLARVVHPNVVAIYDAGEVEDQTFIAMELVPGGTLRDWLSRGPHPLDETLALFEQIGRGLGAVHKAGLIHRDFKPENILLGEDGRPRVTDFGLARTDLGTLTVTTDGQASELADTASPMTLQQLTQTGALLGTPAYMAPEQLRGEPVDVRSDVFAFCVVLYESLTGTRPFAGNSVPELELAIKSNRFVRSPMRLPRGIAALLTRGLAEDPQRRFATLDIVLAELRRLRQPKRSLARTVALVAATLTLVSGAIGFGLWRAQHRIDCSADLMRTVNTPSARRQLDAHLRSAGVPAAQTAADTIGTMLDRYVASWRKASEQVCVETYDLHQQSEATFDARMQCLAHGRNRFGLMMATLAVENKAYLRGADVVELLEPPSDCLATQVDARKPIDPQRQANVQSALDNASVELVFGRLAKARDSFNEAERLADVPGLERQLSEALIGSAISALESNGQGDVGAKTQRGIALAITLHDYRLAARGWLALIRLKMRNLDETLQAAELVRWAMERDTQTSTDRRTDVRVTTLYAECLSAAYLQAGKRDEAEALLRTTLKQKMNRPALTTRLEQSLGNALIDESHFDEAEQTLNSARAHAVEAYGEDSTAVLGIEGTLAYLDFARSGAAAAVPRARHVVAGYRRFGGDQTKSLLQALENLANFLAQSGHDAEAMEVSREVLTIATRELPPDDPMQVTALADLATSLIDAKQYAEARPLLDRALTLGEKLRLHNDSSMINIYSGLAHSILAAGHVTPASRARAIALFDEAAAIGRRFHDRPDIAVVLKEIAALRKELHVP